MPFGNGARASTKKIISDMGAIRRAANAAPAACQTPIVTPGDFVVNKECRARGGVPDRVPPDSFFGTVKNDLFFRILAGFGAKRGPAPAPHIFRH